MRRVSSPRRRGYCVLGLVLALGLLPAAAGAATVTVDTVTDQNSASCPVGDCALREAIAIANPGDTVVFAPALDGGTIDLTLGQLVIAKNLTVDGGTLGITVRAGSPRLFKIQGASTVVALTNLTLRDSPANPVGDKHGGALYNEGQLTLTDVVFRANRSYGVPDVSTSAHGGDGGAIYNAAGASLTLVRVLLRDSGTGNGGFFDGSTTYHAGRGGAIYNAGAMHLVDCTIRDSFTGGGTCSLSDGGDGGAIYNVGTTTITSSTLETSATGDGGSQGQAGCPPFGSAGFDGRGGAIFNAGQLAINNSTLTGNTTATGASGTAAPGGGLYNAPGGTARLRNATIAENTAAASNGGGLYRAAGTAGNNSNLLVKNSLIAKNVALAGTGEDCGNTAGNGALTSESYNLVGVADGCAGVFGINDQVGSAALPLDPLLNALALNGGLTDTYMPQSTSPAIDGANPDNAQCDAWDAGTASSTPFTVDQRGQPRPVDGDGAVGARCDIGSVEAPQPATADLAVTKTDGRTNAVPGGQLTYTIVVTNNGPDPAPGTLVEDLFANSLTCSWTCVPAGGATCTAGPVLDDIADTIDLPAAASATYTVVCTLAANTTGTLTNTATVSLPGLIDPVPGNNTATDVDTVGPEVDLAITKSDGSANEVPGTTVTYTIVASNVSGGNVTTAIVADSFPAAITGVTWTCGATGAGSSCPLSGSGNLNQNVNIGAGGNVTFIATGNIPPGATGTLTNSATVAVPVGTIDPVPSNNTATDVDTLVPTGDLAISKTDGAVDEVPGTSIVYTIVANNPAGGSHAVSATVADTFPGSITGVTWTCAATGTGSSCPASGSGNLNQTVNIGSGGNVTFIATGTIDPGATGTLANTATLTAPGGFTDPSGANNTATDTDTLVPTGNLAITKTDGVANEVPGTAVTYNIVASNPAGGSHAVGATVVDSFPGSVTGVTWTCAATGTGSSCPASGSGNLNQTVNIGAGGNVTFTATGTIDPGATGTLANTATLTAPGSFTDPSGANNTATDTDTLVPTGNLAITKTDGAVNEVPGTSVTYTIVASNPAGGSLAAGATVVDNFPASITGVTWACVPAGVGTLCTSNGVGNLNQSVDIGPGGSVTFTATGTIAPDATGSLVNTTTLTVPPGFTDPSPANNTATDTDTLAPTADLAISKTDAAVSEVPGTTVTYTLVASNLAGPSTAGGATVVDTFPASITGVAWTCAATGTGSSCPASGSGNLNQTVNIGAGGNVTFTATGTIDAGATGMLANTATLTAPGGFTDPSGANNTATDTDTLVPTGNLAITKTDGVVNEVPGTAVTYTIVASNPAGGSLAAGATVTDTFPASITGVTWTCTAAGVGTLCTSSGAGNLNESVDLGSGGSVTFTATGTIAPGATGSLANTATLTAPGGFTDPSPANNTATDTDTLAPTADLAVTKTDGAASEVPGTTVTYTIVASNLAGPSAAVGATIVDTFPASVSAVGWTCVASGAGSSCPVNGSGDLNQVVNIAAGGNVTFTATGTIAATTLGSLSNTATVNAPGGFTDPAGGNNAATDTDVLLADFGDAPDPTYPTLLASNGARHAPGSGLALGMAVDWEPDGQPITGAVGDGSDDDGVVQQTSLQRGAATDFAVTASQPGRLSAWFDWNADGDWNDVGEQAVSDQLLAAGANTVTVSVPAGATLGLTYARFRLATATGLAPTGATGDGEVEDYQVRVGPHSDGFETGTTSRWDGAVSD